MLLTAPRVPASPAVSVLSVQKDSHTVYLEKELESLKVVLEIKNNQLHQKEKKLMEMDKLVGADLRIPDLAASAASRESPVVCDSWKQLCCVCMVLLPECLHTASVAQRGLRSERVSRISCFL